MFLCQVAAFFLSLAIGYIDINDSYFIAIYNKLKWQVNFFISINNELKWQLHSVAHSPKWT